MTVWVRAPWAGPPSRLPGAFERGATLTLMSKAPRFERNSFGPPVFPDATSGICVFGAGASARQGTTIGFTNCEGWPRPFSGEVASASNKGAAGGAVLRNLFGTPGVGAAGAGRDMMASAAHAHKSPLRRLAACLFSLEAPCPNSASPPYRDAHTGYFSDRIPA